jgi:Protein kinase domain
MEVLVNKEDIMTTISPNVRQNELHAGETAHWVQATKKEKQVQLGIQSVLDPKHILTKTLQIQKVRAAIKPADINKEARIHGTTVHFSVHEQLGANRSEEPPYMRITVAIKDLAKVLGVDKKAIKAAVKAGNHEFNALITNRLAEELASKWNEAPVLREPEKKEKKTHDEVDPELRFLHRQPPVPKGKEPENKWAVDKKKGKYAEVSDSDEEPFDPNKAFIRVVKTPKTPQRTEVVCIPPTEDHGLSPKEYEYIKKFYETNIDKLGKEPLHIRKGVSEADGGFPGQDKLAFSLLFLPDDGPDKGLHVLLKTHREINPLGRGSTSEVTVTLHMDSGEESAFRVALADDVPENELEANKELSNDPQRYVAVWPPISYKGSYRARRGREKYATKHDMPRQLNADKIAFLYPLMDDISDKLDALPPVDNTKPKEFPRERLQISLASAKLVGNFAERGFVHRDLKLENTGVGKDGKLRLADFGFTVKAGQKVGYAGTPGYIAPELIIADGRGIEIEADPKMDVWSLGCMLADICGSEIVSEYLRPHDLQDELLAYLLMGDSFDVAREHSFDVAREQYLPHWEDPDHIHFIINKCLEFKPEKRPTAKQVAEFIKGLVPYEGTY